MTSYLNRHFSVFCFAGILSGTLWAFSPFTLNTIILSVGLCTAIYWSYKNAKIKTSWEIIICLLLLCFFSFFYAQSKQITLIPKSTQNEKINIELISEPIEKEKNKRATATIPDGRKIKLIFPLNWDIDYGDRLTVYGKYNEVSPPTNPGQFDYPTYLKRKGFSGTYTAQTVFKHEKRLGNPVYALAIYIQKTIKHMHQKSLPEPYASLYIGLIFGNHGLELPERLKTLFKDTGLTHLLVVSGSQVALLTGILLNITRTIRLGRLPTFIFITAANILFFFITGGEASIFRAILMGEMMLILNLMRRRAHVIHVLCLTASIMILTNPLLIYDYGAYLSFAATAALIFLAPLIEDTLPHTLFKPVRIALSISLAPFLTTLPILWHNFHTINLVSILSNLMMTSWIEILVVIGFFSTIIGSVLFPLMDILNQVSWLTMVLMLKLLPLFTYLPLGNIYASSKHIIIPISFFILIIQCLINIQKKKRKLFRRYLSVIIIFILILIIPPILTKKPLTVTFLDVDQGDATLIETPSGKVILVDLGKNHAKRVLVPVLQAKGINKIDVLIISHFDLDHYGSLFELLEHIEVGSVIDNGRGELKISNYADVLKRHKIKRFKGSAEHDLEFDDGVKIDFLTLLPGQVMDSENNYSIAMKISYLDLGILLTGDLEVDGEALLARVYGETLDVDILKIGHHGSKTSSIVPFLNYVTPDIAIASAGKRNHYGHPNPDVIKRFNDAGVHVLQTNRHGAITVIKSKNRQSTTPFLLDR